MTGGLVPGDVVSIVGRPALGKAQPLDAKVLTPSGWVRMGDLKVGDDVVSPDGEPSKVLEIHPQGIKQTFTVFFADGRSTECCTRHLWRVYSRHWKEKWRVMTTRDVMDLLSSKRHQNRLAVELISGDWGVEKKLPIDPYVLGALIGDGGFTGGSVILTSADPFIVEKVDSRLESPYMMDVACVNSKYGYRIVRYQGHDYVRENEYKDKLTCLGLWGLKSHEKFIPDGYKTASKQQRLDLLHGLMDTDGTVSKDDGSLQYCTTSLRLARDVQSLVWSLGGVCKIAIKKTTHKDAYILGLRHNDPSTLVSLPRKKERVPSDYQFAGCVRAVIDRIVPSTKDVCQCITVSHPSRLYVTDNFIVTHNSFSCLFNGLNAYDAGHDVLHSSMEMENQENVQRLSAMAARIKLTDLYTGDIGSFALKRLKAGLSVLKARPNKLWLMDGNLSASVDDIFMIATQLKPQLIVIDGAYLVSLQGERDRYRRVAENAERIKKQLAPIAPVICTWQFSREANKKKKDEAVTLDDIAYSDVIGQISSVVIGLFEDDSAETDHRRKLTILKGRKGGVGSFLVRWDFNVMDFREAEDDISKLKFL